MTETTSTPPTLPTLVVKTVVVHTVTYFVAGILAYTINGYQAAYIQPPLSYFMRPTTDAVVMAGPLFQPIRGIIFALAFYPLRTILFAPPRGWLVMWWLLLALGVLSTFGAALGSIEGLIYTIVPPAKQIVGLWEVVLQSLLLSVILHHWVTRPDKRWLSWTLGVAFIVVLALPLLGLATRK